MALNKGDFQLIQELGQCHSEPGWESQTGIQNNNIYGKIAFRNSNLFKSWPRLNFQESRGSGPD